MNWLSLKIDGSGYSFLPDKPSGRDVALIGSSSQSRQMNRKHACFLPILDSCVKGSSSLLPCCSSRTHWLLVEEGKLKEFQAQ